MPAVCRLAASIFVATILVCCSPAGRCQDNGVGARFGNGSTASVSHFTQDVHDHFMNYSESFASEILQHLGFCINDPVMDWNGAFNFSADLGFLANCIEEINGNITLRLCTVAEIKFYFSNLFINGGNGNSNFLRPNINCNATSWVSGCEPGWACSVGEDQKVLLKDANKMPSRTQNCLPCCEGFFCPHGITCMIPCPLGAYCPRAILDTSTGVCSPYSYQPPPGQTNHSCGGADRWADVVTSGEIFCPAGYYCPSTITKVSCGSGHYCRKGSTSQERCFKKSSCKPNSANQDITIFGVLLMSSAELDIHWHLHHECSSSVSCTVDLFDDVHDAMEHVHCFECAY